MRNWLPWIGVGSAVLLVLVFAGKKTGTHGVSIVDGKLELSDWTAWMWWAPETIAEARTYGAVSGEQIATYMFSQIFPERIWPPVPGDPITETWRQIALDIQKLVPTLEAEEAEQRQLDGKVVPLRGGA